MSEVDPGACAALVTYLRGRCAADVTAMPPGPFRRSPSGLSLGSLLCATPGPDHATWDVVLATVLPRHRHGPGRALPAQHLTLIPAPAPPWPSQRRMAPVDTNQSMSLVSSEASHTPPLPLRLKCSFLRPHGQTRLLRNLARLNNNKQTTRFKNRQRT